MERHGIDAELQASRREIRGLRRVAGERPIPLDVRSGAADRVSDTVGFPRNKLGGQYLLGQCQGYHGFRLWR